MTLTWAFAFTPGVLVILIQTALANARGMSEVHRNKAAVWAVVFFSFAVEGL